MRRRKHYKEIIAWANGHEIELKHFNSNGSVWKIDENPTWNEEYTYRIHNPLKEVKEAFERGETVQYQEIDDNRWIDLYKKAKDISWILLILNGE